MKTRIAAIATAAVLVIGGGTAYALSSNDQPAPVETSASAEPTPTEVAPAEAAPESAPEPAALPVHITEPGEVCDPHNANDSICAAFYPDQAVLNMTSPERSREPLASMAPAEKISLAHQACENLEAGSKPSLVATIPADGDPDQMADRNNTGIYAAGAVAYCNEYAGGPAAHPDRIARLVTFYKALGEDGAKAHFADKIMPTPAELGY